MKALLLSLACVAATAVSAGAQALGTTARQLPAGSLKILAYYQGVQDQTVKFDAGGSGACRSQNGAASFFCGGGGDVEAKGSGGAGLVKLVYQPREVLQYYAAFGVGDYNLDVPSTTYINRLRGDRPGMIMTAGVKAVLYPDTVVTPAIATDLSVSRARYWFNRVRPSDAAVAVSSIDQRLDLMMLQVAVEASHVFTLQDADEKADEKAGLVALRNQGIKLEPYGGVKWLRIQSDLKDLADGTHSGGQQDTVTPFLGLRLPLGRSEGFFAEAQFVDGYVYAAGLELRFGKGS